MDKIADILAEQDKLLKIKPQTEHIANRLSVLSACLRLLMCEMRG